jgi:hypothetical protein
MKRRLVPCLAACVFASSAVLTVRAADRASSANAGELAPQVRSLVRQLNDDSAARRDAAEAGLIDLAGTNAESVDRFLALLPEDGDQMPLAVRDRLGRIRTLVEDRAAKAAIEATSVTLAVDNLPIWDALLAVAKQTGNRVVDHRQQSGEGRASRTLVTAQFKNEPYWSAVDALLDQANLGMYAYAGDDALAVVEREAGDGQRRGSAAYCGPFRLEVLEVQTERGLRKPDQKSLKLQLEVAWEPRLRPIAVTQAAADLAAIDDAGEKIAVARPEAVLDAEVTAGTQATELVLPFELPRREVKRITSLKGKLRALVPGRQVKFQFDDLAHAAGKSQRRGGVQVAIDSVRKNNEIWEIHMRLRLDEANHALESHRGWAFQNLSYLVDQQGETIDNAGLETTSQGQNEVGVAYFFDLPKGLDGLTWVYETPAAIVELPVEYELRDIELP